MACATWRRRDLSIATSELPTSWWEMETLRRSLTSVWPDFLTTIVNTKVSMRIIKVCCSIMLVVQHFDNLRNIIKLLNFELGWQLVLYWFLFCMNPNHVLSSLLQRTKQHRHQLRSLPPEDDRNFLTRTIY